MRVVVVVPVLELMAAMFLAAHFRQYRIRVMIVLV